MFENELKNIFCFAMENKAKKTQAVGDDAPEVPLVLLANKRDLEGIVDGIEIWKSTNFTAYHKKIWSNSSFIVKFSLLIEKRMSFFNMHSVLFKILFKVLKKL